MMKRMFSIGIAGGLVLSACAVDYTWHVFYCPVGGRRRDGGSPCGRVAIIATVWRAAIWMANEKENKK